LASLSLRVGIFGSEVWSDELRRRIERELAIRSFDIIGMTETGGPGMGIDCAARAGIHVWEDHYHPEIVDPATGAVVPDGTEGELVVSTLTRVGLPAVGARIRRELSDLLALSPEVRLAKLGELERSQGKAVRVVDRRTVR